MKKSALFLLISGTTLLLASCSRRSYPTDDRYPQERRVPDRNPYPQERPVVIYAPPPQDLPPGQAKKIYGGKSAREYAHRKHGKHGKCYTPSYGQRGYPLIIIRTPDIVINRYNDGRYYHRNGDGLFYWLRPDNRFYLDEQYINDVQYDEAEYRSWSGIIQPSRSRNNDDDDDDNRGRGKKDKDHGKKGKHGKHHND
jgi:hypothetical protein